MENTVVVTVYDHFWLVWDSLVLLAQVAMFAFDLLILGQWNRMHYSVYWTSSSEDDMIFDFP